MVFRGSPEDMQKLKDGIKQLKEDPAYEYVWPVWEDGCWEDEKEPSVFTADSDEGGRINGISEAMEALHRFAPESEAACRTLAFDFEEDGYDVYYIAPGAETAVNVEIGYAWMEEEAEEEADEFDLIEVEVSEYGEPFFMKIQKGFQQVLDFWDSWDSE